MPGSYCEFIRTPTYEAARVGLLSLDEEWEYVEKPLLADPHAGVLMAGTGGFRKLRVPLRGRGKSSGGRVVYYWAGASGRIYLVAFFAKSEKENLTKAERNALKQIAKTLETEP